MVNGESEMRALMTFWAKHLKSGMPEAASGQEYVEISSGSSSLGLLQAKK